MERKTYNGWTNYETWLLNLWMGEGGEQEMWEERAKELGKDEAHILGQELKEAKEEEAYHEIRGGSGWISDMVGASLAEVDWQEIAQRIIDDAAWESEEAE